MMRIKLLGMLLACLLLNGCNNPNNEKRSSGNTKSVVSEGFLTAEVLRLDLGEMNKQSATKYDFAFNLCNESDTVALISNVDVSCGCVSITEYPDSVLPHSTQSIKGVVDITNQHNRLNKAIFVAYNDKYTLLLRVLGVINE